jgi:hypothetical protein
VNALGLRIFMRHLNGALGIPATRENRKLELAWHRAEGGSAKWNPWNTEYPLPRATNYNQQGVKNYPREVMGLAATILTLSNGLYNGILGDLQSGKFTAKQIVQRNAAEFDKWGTHASHILPLL